MKEGERLLLLRTKGNLTLEERKDLIISEAKLSDAILKLAKPSRDKMMRPEQVKTK